MVVLIAFVLSAIASSAFSDCPCNDPSLCEPISTEYEKEIFGFSSMDMDAWNEYNWTRLTTLVSSNLDNTSDYMCMAHSHGVRLTHWGANGFPTNENETALNEWVASFYDEISSRHLDGMSFDFEGIVNATSPFRSWYTHVVNTTTNYFHARQPGSQISVCVAWSPYNVDQRNFDYVGLAEASDLLYLMVYDTRSMVLDACIASANSPIGTLSYGLNGYLELGIAKEKLVAGFPWYGYNYTCVMESMESDESRFCPIGFAPFRGYPCTDAAGNERSYAKLMNVIDLGLNITEIGWDYNMQAPWFNYEWPHSANPKQVFQAWFDDPASLASKHAYAKQMGIRGVGPFMFNDLYWTYSNQEIKRANAIWQSFEAFF